MNYIVSSILLISLLMQSSGFNNNLSSSMRSKTRIMGKYKHDELHPKSVNQKLYHDALEKINNGIIIGVGPAGSGKTLFACQAAIKELKSKQVKKIVITRPLISVEREDIGFLPGTLTDKMDPWTKPIVDILCNLLTKETVDKMILSGIIELSPLAYMRGRTFRDAFIIADEMQNSSPNQMKMLTTRIGEGSKMVINGDLKQSDYTNKMKNGLYDLIERIENHITDTSYEYDEFCGIDIIYMKHDDVHRSKIVSKILLMYDEE